MWGYLSDEEIALFQSIPDDPITQITATIKELEIRKYRMAGLRIAGSTSSAAVGVNEIIRVKPTVSAKILGYTQIRYAVYNDGWY